MIDLDTLMKIASAAGGSAGAGAAVFLFKALRKEARAVRTQPRPIFENGTLEDVRKALALLGAASTDYRQRIGELENESNAGKRDHLDFDFRLAWSEKKITTLAERIALLEKQA